MSFGSRRSRQDHLIGTSGVNAGIENWDHEADLSKAPWFLDDFDELFGQMGFPRERRLRALLEHRTV